MTWRASCRAFVLVLLVIEGACAWGGIVEYDGIRPPAGEDAGVLDGAGRVDAGDAGGDDAGSPDADGGATDDAGATDADGGTLDADGGATDGDDGGAPDANVDGGDDPCVDPTICGAFGDPLVRTGFCDPLGGGRYRCLCMKGFEKANPEQEDAPCTIDPCAPDRDTCALGACVRSPPTTEGQPELTDGTYWPGDWTCECPAGSLHEKAGDNYARCRDVDECAPGNHTCGDHEDCLNLVPGFSCTCSFGYVRDGSACVDFDECQVNNGGCATFAVCTNTDGGRTCVCPDGFTGNGDFLCEDIDECVIGNGPCDPNNSYCVNDKPSYHCHCFPGYKNADRFTCEDLDECAEGKVSCIDPYATCVNFPGGARCDCPVNWLKKGDGTCVPP